MTITKRVWIAMAIAAISGAIIMQVIDSGNTDAAYERGRGDYDSTLAKQIEFEWQVLSKIHFAELAEIRDTIQQLSSRLSLEISKKVLTTYELDPIIGTRDTVRTIYNSTITWGAYDEGVIDAVWGSFDSAMVNNVEYLRGYVRGMKGLLRVKGEAK